MFYFIIFMFTNLFSDVGTNKYYITRVGQKEKVANREMSPNESTTRLGSSNCKKNFFFSLFFITHRLMYGRQRSPFPAGVAARVVAAVAAFFVIHFFFSQFISVSEGTYDYSYVRSTNFFFKVIISMIPFENRVVCRFDTPTLVFDNSTPRAAGVAAAAAILLHRYRVCL